MIILGLTGSIGMGKTTTAGFFEEAGVPVYNADRAVHELYENKPVIEDLSRIFPDCLTDGRIDRSKLSKTIVKNPSKLAILEKFIHPLVRKKEKDFVKMHRDRGDPLVVLDIPLLFETGPDGRVDKIAVVSAPLEVQRQRVLARSGWDDEKLNRILSRQISDEEKRRRADFVIDTGKSLDDAREQVKHLIARLILK